jgi:hypothetical protein
MAGKKYREYFKSGAAQGFRRCWLGVFIPWLFLNTDKYNMY